MIHHHFVILELSSPVLKSAVKIFHDENFCILCNSQKSQKYLTTKIWNYTVYSDLPALQIWVDWKK